MQYRTVYLRIIWLKLVWHILATVKLHVLNLCTKFRCRRPMSRNPIFLICIHLHLEYHNTIHSDKFRKKEKKRKRKKQIQKKTIYSPHIADVLYGSFENYFVYLKQSAVLHNPVWTVIERTSSLVRPTWAMQYTWWHWEPWSLLCVCLKTVIKLIWHSEDNKRLMKHMFQTNSHAHGVFRGFHGSNP